MQKCRLLLETVSRGKNRDPAGGGRMLLGGLMASTSGGKEGCSVRSERQGAQPLHWGSACFWEPLSSLCCLRGPLLVARCLVPWGYSLFPVLLQQGRDHPQLGCIHSDAIICWGRTEAAGALAGIFFYLIWLLSPVHSAVG